MSFQLLIPHYFIRDNNNNQSENSIIQKKYILKIVLHPLEILWRWVGNRSVIVFVIIIPFTEHYWIQDHYQKKYGQTRLIIGNLCLYYQNSFTGDIIVFGFLLVHFQVYYYNFLFYYSNIKFYYSTFKIYFSNIEVYYSTFKSYYSISCCYYSNVKYYCSNLEREMVQSY